MGHLLPYITHHEARAWDISHDREHGWLDNLEGGAGALPERYLARVSLARHQRQVSVIAGRGGGALRG